MATLIACAPWEPPKIKILGGPANERSPAELSDRNSERTGLPATMALLPKYAAVDSKVTAAALTAGASSRLGRPGTAFCSSSNVGTLRIAAINTTGPELYPLTPITRSGEAREMIDQASMPLS